MSIAVEWRRRQNRFNISAIHDPLQTSGRAAKSNYLLLRRAHQQAGDVVVAAGLVGGIHQAGSKAAPKLKSSASSDSISASGSSRVRPSEHSRKRSPGSASKLKDIRRHAALCAQRAGNHVLERRTQASERVMRPSRTCSSTSEWSWVICSRRPREAGNSGCRPH
jgi:hypothetical protein